MKKQPCIDCYGLGVILTESWVKLLFHPTIQPVCLTCKGTGEVDQILGTEVSIDLQDRCSNETYNACFNAIFRQ